ncbi:MAG: hypothetical protein FVQ83_17115 [Chloroflexi bacterium]|nr:hypothetical protein [Chloroflexota bacterium]
MTPRKTPKQKKKPSIAPRINNDGIYRMLPADALDRLIEKFRTTVCQSPAFLDLDSTPLELAYFQFIFAMITLGGQVGNKSIDSIAIMT